MSEVFEIISDESIQKENPSKGHCKKLLMNFYYIILQKK